MQRIVYVLLVLFYSLHADEEAIQGRLSADQQPQAVVGGCVNVVSGSFFFSENDLPAVGLGSLQLVRCYDSGNSEKGFFGKGMSHTFPINLKAKEKHPGSSKYSVDASLSLGESSAIPYEGKLNTKKGGLCSMPGDFRRESGYTGSINPLNRMEPHLGKIRISSEKKGKWTVQLSNGTQRYFEHKDDYDHRLMLEELPNGQSFHYKYYSDKSLRVLLKDAEGTAMSSLLMWDGSTKFATLDGKKKCKYHFDSRSRL